MNRFALTLLALLLVVAPPSGAEEQAKPGLTVFAAASMADVLTEIGQAFEAKTGVHVRFSFAASSALARQVESGAPADVFVSADIDWMDYLEQRSLIDKATRRDVAGNRLVLIAPQDSRVDLKIAPGFELLRALGAGRLATGDPASVPVGRYARDALMSLGVWQQVESRLVPAENVRVALAYVSRGEVPLGIVYQTDALIDAKVKVIDVFPENTHPAIVYPAAATARAKPEAASFVAYLGDDDARALFSKYGFGLPK